MFQLSAACEEGEYAMTLSETSTEVKYDLNIKKMRFNDTESTLFLFRDLTQEEKLHTALMEQKYRAALLSTVTHEFRTPLMIIRGNLDTWLQDHAQQSPACFQPPAQIVTALLATSLLKQFLRDISVLFPRETAVGREETR